MSTNLEKEKSILIVEDEIFICELITRILKDQAHVIDVAHDGRTAEELITIHNYNLVLLDMKLPVESGFELFVWLQQEYPALSKRVIFMTGSILSNETRIILEKCKQPYILKPFRPDELKRIVTDFLEKSH